jgi:hypothetical protein
MRIENVRLCGKFGNFIKFITEKEALRLVKHGKAEETYRYRHGKPKEFQGVRLVDVGATNSAPSAASIRNSEMLANAFSFLKFKDSQSRTAKLTEQKRSELELAGKEPEDYIERAQEKIRIWPEIRNGIDPRRYELEALASPAVQ